MSGFCDSGSEKFNKFKVDVGVFSANAKCHLEDLKNYLNFSFSDLKESIKNLPETMSEAMGNLGNTLSANAGSIGSTAGKLLSEASSLALLWQLPLWLDWWQPSSI